MERQGASSCSYSVAPQRLSLPMGTAGLLAPYESLRARPLAGRAQSGQRLCDHWQDFPCAWKRSYLMVTVSRGRATALLLGLVSVVGVCGMAQAQDKAHKSSDQAPSQCVGSRSWSGCPSHCKASWSWHSAPASRRHRRRGRSHHASHGKEKIKVGRRRLAGTFRWPVDCS